MELNQKIISKIGIISNKPPTYSETFITAHLKKLPTNTLFFYGRWFPLYNENHQPIHQNSLSDQIQRQFLKKVFRQQSTQRDRKTLQQLLIKEQLDVVLAEYGMTGAAVLPVCQKSQIPLVVHFHGYDAYDQRILRKYQNIYQELFREAGAIIVVSQDMKQQLLQLGATPEKLYYNPYGVDLSLFRQAKPAQNPPHFIAVGRFVDKKAPHLTIMAFNQVAKQYPEAKLYMVGSGFLLKKCQRLVKSLQLSQQVEFLGACSHEEVALKMQQARAFVQHSVRAKSGDSEGTPVAVLEASASTLPVIATRHAGIKDVVMDNETGLLCEEGEVEVMARNMLQVIQSPQLAQQLGKAGRERIQKYFSLETSLKNLWEILTSVAQK